MNLPIINQVGSPKSHQEDTIGMFKRLDSPNLVSHDPDLFVSQLPRYMTGYTGCRRKEPNEDVIFPKVLTPVIGYCGHYRGKNVGKLGRAALHKTQISTWEKDTVSDILGIPAVGNDWEYAHYTASCGNFASKLSYEPAQTSREELSTAGSNSSGRGPEVAVDLNKVVIYIHHCLEARFKSSLVARSQLKAAFFAKDPRRTGVITEYEFITILQKAGIFLPELEFQVLFAALREMVYSYYEQGIDNHFGSCLSPTAQGGGSNSPTKLNHNNNNNNNSFRRETAPAAAPAGAMEGNVQYGFFLNSIVPSADSQGKGGNGNGVNSRSLTRQSTHASVLSVLTTG